MDAPSPNSSNPSVPRQRSSPANDPSPSPSPIPTQHSQPYPYPVQQQQAGWNAQAQPFYPSFYQNPHQQPYPIHPHPSHPSQGQMPPQGAYFDPNAQFAQWAYQQMMFNAQQQALSHVPQAPSPLSQRGRSSSTSAPGEYFTQNPMPGFNAFPSGNITAADKRKSRDDSDLAAMMEPIPSQNMLRSGGLKGRLRRALSLSAAQAMHEEESDIADSKSASHPNGAGSTASGSVGGSASPSLSVAPDAGDAGSTATRKKKKSRTALFNSRLNASTDNISLSSTMSSASVVIRKLGSIGKLARRNSIAGITSLFKDKKDKEDAEGSGKKSKKKKGDKGEAAEASVSHVTAELDRSGSEWSAELNGLSPAAKLARQHTLKSNAEAAARAKAVEEEAASAAQAAEHVPTTWEKNTTSRHGESPARAGGYRVNEEGMRVIVEDDDSASEGESAHDYSSHLDGWDDEDWNHIEEDDEDLTIRQGLERTSFGSEGETEPWAVNVRRSLERSKTPAKGILKNADKYDQHSFMGSMSGSARGRSNSYNSPAAQQSELGPLARIPSPDPDHIDGLHRHPSHSSAHSKDPLAFASNLSVYDTFPATVYDRRSEPATWSRLTPALAQRIKEELNSYKMEEMEVHAASRIQ
ncbi:hypothetical protein HETIRDRAFT_306543 [Heterobasidion irregulare TC 32-1]|uniref:Uncharacterized protein n=1 Tax=Heterobasidion irregulare (strain TC 32-1) TaxID=747525 RepID=W4KPM8_HETIT|nr:uncharacterized protein HETIRDRAFT_306543 [Heterobasidion irregulare TC 32-1]ETW87773.1 hypothetical protein HETIRDRAFT_306543 [Heterobasidion irregulare TC 32-1]